MDRTLRFLAPAGVLILAAAARGQAVPDPSFEISGPAFQASLPTVWQAGSTNFGAPFCNGDCLGPGQPTGARTGEWWCWFGGTSALEQAAVWQVVAIPAGAPVLRLHLFAFSDRPTSTDRLRVLVDTTVVLAINNQQILPYLTGYEPIDIDLAGFAGTSRTLRIEAETLAGPGITNFFVDDVSIVSPPPACYANCDGSTTAPVLNVQDFGCFLTRYAAGEAYANCDQSTQPPVLNVQDFGCFLTQYAAGCP
ncbi:MAG: hypothetical protein WD749_10015 [Phycisphaerales bacterium]